jgi:phenylpropionate dioxygenase-like ring-hydroxylating dioxygenase large terminal subunit
MYVEFYQMLNHFWYAVEHSESVKIKPKSVVLMDQEIVLYRQHSGNVIALDNRCAHRGTALSGGWVEETCIRCPYHGWKYDADGTCIEIPANQPGVTIGQRTKLRAYPVQEKYGLIWLYLGNRPEEERPSLPPLPAFSDPTWRTVRGEFVWDGHYTRVIANTVDMAHAAFVHSSAFGRKEKPRIQQYQLEEEAWTARATIHFKTKPAHFLKLILGKSPPDGSITSSFFLPNITQVYHRFGDIEFILFLAHVPISNSRTITKWLHLRNFVTHPLADPFMRRDVAKTFVQDNSVVKLQPVGPVPKLRDEMHVPSDALELAYRKLREQYQSTSVIGKS